LYVVATPLPAHGFVWDEPTTSWIDAGPVQGPQGIPGEQGVAGEKGDPADLPADVVFLAAEQTLTNKTLTGPKMNIIFDSNFGKPALGISNAKGQAAAENYMVLYGAAAGQSPVFMAYGVEENIGFDVQTKGAGQFTVNGEPVGGGGSDYTLPPATASTLGGVKAGAGLSVTADGTLSSTVAGNYLLKTGDVMNGALRFASTGVSTYNSTDVYMFWDGTYFRCKMPAGGQGWIVAGDGKVSFPNTVPSCNFAPTATGDLTNKAYVDAQISGSTAFLKITGGTMTGTITTPTTVQAFTFGTSGYNIFGASGGVAIRSNTTNVINFTAAEIAASVPITTAGSGVGVRFGSGGPSLSKSGTTIASSAPITVAAAPVNATELANKKYVDDAIAAAIAALR
jgi:hypothetical protein